MCVNSCWAWCREYSPRWYVLNSSISPLKVTDLLIVIVTIYVWWTRCGKSCPRWCVLNSSISQWKVTYFPIAIDVWVLGGLGVQSTPLEDMSSTRQYHNGKWHISSLYFCHYICVWILGGLGVAAHCCSLLLCATLYCSLVFAAWLQPAMEQGTHPVTTPGTRQQITKKP